MFFIMTSTTNTSASVADKSKPSLEDYDVSSFLKAGVQFGHETKRWNPKMKKFIFAQKNNIHILDISKTIELLDVALKFLSETASKGDILFVGTKRQAAEIIKEQAISSGAYYITNRWPGGLLTNFEQIKQSLKRYKELEKEFQEGVEGRTKFEVSNMKKEWVKMNRLYEGIKNMTGFPKAMVVVDVNYERKVLTEAKRLGIPVVAIVDTNTDPDLVDYPIPGNDDAISSLKLLIGFLGGAVKKGNGGKGIKHEYIDYSTYEVKILKTEDKKEELVEVGEKAKVQFVEPMKVTTGKKSSNQKGILENIQKEREAKRQVEASQEREVSAK